jgi:hypothetical protein
LDFGSFIKYGITNVPRRRLRDHKKNGRYLVVFNELFEDGTKAFILEQNVKRILGGHFVEKEQCPDGYTETLCRSKLDSLLTLINDIITTSN